MKNRKNTSNLNVPNSPINTQISIECLLQTAEEGLIVFNLQGAIITINPRAAQYLGYSVSQLKNQYITSVLTLDTFTRKRQFVQLCAHFNAAQTGVGQSYTWIEYLKEKPIFAYNVLMNKEEIDGNTFIVAQLNDVLPKTIINWALWSLAKIGNHHEITGIIDELLQLASNVFSADYAAVCLIDKQYQSHAVSYYEWGKKKENASYPFIKPFYEQLNNKEIIQTHNAQQKHPDNELLSQLNINSYVVGPIINAGDSVVGTFILCAQQTLIQEKTTYTLFGLFLKRINLEIERLLDQRRLQFLASIPQQNPNAVLRMLPTGQVIYANSEGENILAYWHAHLPKQLLDCAERAYRTKEAISLELEVNTKIYLFTLLWIEEFQQINIYGTDISQLKLTEHKMTAMARFDALTQIANRQYFDEVLKQKLKEHQKQQLSLALLLIDLDNFKAVNDTLGHGAGDKLLQQATQRMLHTLRQEDFIARLGGDEFIVILNDTNLIDAQHVAEKIIHLLSQTFHFETLQMHVTASIGIALYPHTGLTSSDLLKNADIAMYEAKSKGKNMFSVFSKSAHYEQNKRNELIKKDLKLAASKNQLFIEYQPQIDIIHNTIVGLEALLRWYHPIEGLLLPKEFIPLAEQTGCIHLLGNWLFQQTLQDYAAIIAANSGLELTLNISFSQLNDARFLGELNKEINRYHINPKNITLDISERVLTQHTKLISQSLKKITQEGMQLCLDDFGNPNASLLQLINLPMNSLKLDSQLLIDLEKNEKYRILLKNILLLTRELRLKTIQKGVENEEQHKLIKALGCRYAQGFYYCKPIRIEQLGSFMTQYKLKI